MSGTILCTLSLFHLRSSPGRWDIRQGALSYKKQSRSSSNGNGRKCVGLLRELEGEAQKLGHPGGLGTRKQGWVTISTHPISPPSAHGLSSLSQWGVLHTAQKPLRLPS